MRQTAVAAFCVALLAVARGAAAQPCPAGTTPVLWPSSSPVWDFCFARPATSPLPNGEGLTLRQVKYKGVLVLERASIPILNVFYQNGCSPCLRDWFDQERAFECAPAVAPGQCSGTTTPATTVCQHPGTDAGTFSGVAVEDKGTHLKLMSQAEAGWYRYIPVWEFWPDGTLQARMDASAVADACVQFTHDHHAYWRLDFDLAGSAGDFVDDLTAPVGSQRVSTERNFLDGSPQRRRWKVGSAGTNTTVEVIRNAGDGAAGDPPAFAGDNPVADGWLLAYDATQLTDNPVACYANLVPFINGQSVDGADIVLWVRASGVHEGELSGVPQECHMFGPTLRVREAAITPSAFHTLPPCRLLDTRRAAGPYGGPALAAGADRTVVLASQCGIPTSARAVAANLTVTQPTDQGHIQIGPVGGPMPSTSVMNFTAGQTRANNAVLELGASGAVLVRSVLPAGSLHFVLDVNGYFE
jgi:hypothetical protein